MKIRTLIALLAVTLTACQAAPTPTPAEAVATAMPSPEVVALSHALDLVQKQRDDLASQLLTMNVKAQLLSEQIQALKPAPTPTPAPAAKK